ncbi:hypothetical protein KFL_005980020 [Klebsormidium nitens]|uniref:Uncharacterized protein n=1 Tax=Klebsormidium nitens TaxID=105231 RepID=A0A1Y1IN96_KLENI|nr:hypothetical protein KFL_005980020 [Klebsormidium nitens]|eukprot:GAQ90087.1 hypothetical protein KFL_005980020 [Klebsormidium nitens]
MFKSAILCSPLNFGTDRRSSAFGGRAQIRSSLQGAATCPPNRRCSKTEQSAKRSKSASDLIPRNGALERNNGEEWCQTFLLLAANLAGVLLQKLGGGGNGREDGPKLRELQNASRGTRARSLLRGLLAVGIAEIRHIPGVMLQLFLGPYERIHFFYEGTSDTYIHNHRLPFWTACLAGGYEESLYEVSSREGGEHFRCKREPGGRLSAAYTAPGKVIKVKTRAHAPGHVMCVRSEQFHAVRVKARSTLTYAEYDASLPTSEVFVLSNRRIMEMEAEEEQATRPATLSERAKFALRLVRQIKELVGSEA